MAMSVATKTNFLGLENFCLLFIAYALPLYPDHFDVLHYLLQLCYALNTTVFHTQRHSLKKLEASESNPQQEQEQQEQQQQQQQQ